MKFTERNRIRLVALLAFCAIQLNAQRSMLSEFSALPAFPKTAKAAFSVCQTSVVNSYYTFKNYSAPTVAYQKRLEDDTKPLQAIITAKGNSLTTPGLGAANDFADLNSPETQAKLAKMTQEEKIKFAMEIQERMKNNKKLQTVSSATKPSPLTGMILKLNASSQKLLALLPDFSPKPLSGYGACDNLCPIVDDPTCSGRIKACESKVAHAYFDPELKRFDDLMKNTISQFSLNKVEFEKDLKEFDALASKYNLSDVATDYMSVLTMISGFAIKLQEYEKQGAQLIIEAKNNPYCKSDY